MDKFKQHFWLEKFDCFSIYGNDSKKFLNGITTANITNIKSKFSKTCWLSPNGVLRGLLEIIFLENKLEIIILEGDTSEILDNFNKVIFPADDVSLSQSFTIKRFQEVDEINSWKVNQPVLFKDDDKEYEIYKNQINLLNHNDLKFWKINQAIPSLRYEIDGKNNPLELGLTDLVDFNKGCFLGQEKISKIKNSAPLKQEIRVWNSKASSINLESANKNLYINSSKENAVGKITSFYKFDDQIQGLAMIKKKYLEIGDNFYSEIYGKINIKKSIGSNFI